MTAESRDSPIDSGGRHPLRRGAVGVLRLARPFVLAYLVLLLLMMLFEERLIFFPAPYDPADPVWRPPGLEFEDAWFTADDGTRLHGWYCPVDEPRAVLLFAHGNAGHLAHRAPLIRIWQEQLQATVMIFDYRGYGRSEGRPTGRGILKDARAARAWLAERAEVDPDEIVVMGHSIGGAVAVYLAAEQPPRALIVESGFTSLADVGKLHYGWFPVRLVLRTRLDPLEQISRYEGPLFVSHGTDDEIVPLDFGRRLFEEAGGVKQFYPIEGGTHNSMPPAAYYRQLRKFLDELP